MLAPNYYLTAPFPCDAGAGAEASRRPPENERTVERLNERDTKIWKWNEAARRFQSRWLPVHVNAVGSRQDSDRMPTISRGQKCRVSTTGHRDAARLITASGVCNTELSLRYGEEPRHFLDCYVSATLNMWVVNFRRLLPGGGCGWGVGWAARGLAEWKFDGFSGISCWAGDGTAQ